MKIKFIRYCRYFFNLREPIIEHKEGEIIDIADAKAEQLINDGYAEKEKREYKKKKKSKGSEKVGMTVENKVIESDENK